MHTTHTHTRARRSNAEHNTTIAKCAFELRFVKYLKRTSPPPLNSGGQEKARKKKVRNL